MYSNITINRLNNCNNIYTYLQLRSNESLSYVNIIFNNHIKYLQQQHPLIQFIFPLQIGLRLKSSLLLFYDIYVHVSNNLNNNIYFPLQIGVSLKSSLPLFYDIYVHV